MDILSLALLLISGAALCVFYFLYRKIRFAKRKVAIDAYQFPPGILEKVLTKYPHLTTEDLNKVLCGLRDYFHVCNTADKRVVSMPSQVIDVAWHEFILYTRRYKEFCNKSLGRFLHHTPAEAMTAPTLAQIGIKRAWRVSCYLEDINPQVPNRLPLLFAIDSLLAIPDGFTYSLNCLASEGKGGYCAGNIGCGGGCAGSSGDSSCGGGCGGD